MEQEAETTEFERRKREAEQISEAKTAKNRAKRQKKRERTKTKGAVDGGKNADGGEPVFKKRRLVNGAGLVFRKPGEGSDVEDEVEGSDNHGSDDGRTEDIATVTAAVVAADTHEQQPKTIQEPRIVIHDD
jgi:hypothetical protein